MRDPSGAFLVPARILRGKGTAEYPIKYTLSNFRHTSAAPRGSASSAKNNKHGHSMATYP